MSVKQIARENGLAVMAWAPGKGKAIAPRAEKPKERTGQLPKIPTRPGKAAPAPKQKGPVVPKLPAKKPTEKKPTVQPYSKMANSRAAGLLKLAIKWAKTAPDPETKRTLIEGIKVLKKVYWARLSAESKKELNEL